MQYAGHWSLIMNQPRCAARVERITHITYFAPSARRRHGPGIFPGSFHTPEMQPCVSSRLGAARDALPAIQTMDAPDRKTTMPSSTGKTVSEPAAGREREYSEADTTQPPAMHPDDTEAMTDRVNVGLADLATTLARVVAKRNSGSKIAGGQSTSSQSEKIAEAVVDAAIRQLKEMTDWLLLGEDSRLENTWEEICVQAQGEKTIAWDTYVDTMKSILTPAVRALGRREQDLLWLRTEGGKDWQAEIDDDSDMSHDDSEDDDVGEVGQGKYPSIPDERDQIVSYLLDLLLTEAEDFENDNVREYLDKHSFA
jgi:hypothetical protein